MSIVVNFLPLFSTVTEIYAEEYLRRPHFMYSVFSLIVYSSDFFLQFVPTGYALDPSVQGIDSPSGDRFDFILRLWLCCYESTFKELCILWLVSLSLLQLNKHVVLIILETQVTILSIHIFVNILKTFSLCIVNL